MVRSLAAVTVLALGCTAGVDYGDTAFLCTAEPACPESFECRLGRCVPEDSPRRFRRPLAIDNAGRGELEDFPVLVALDQARIDYDFAGDGGAAVRFTAEDGVTLLPHEIETWDPAGESLVWVRIPTLAADASTSIYMMWGEEPPPPLDPAETFAAPHLGVWHLDEDPGAEPIADSTAGGLTGTAEDSMDGDNLVAGPLAGALHFDNDQFVDFGDADALELPVYSWSLWIRGDEAADSTGVVNGQPLFNADAQFNFSWNHEAPTFARAATHDDGDGFTPAQIPQPLEGGSWYHVAATYDGTNLRVFLDGELETSVPMGAPITEDGPLTIGNDPGNGGFSGDLDEVRIYRAAVSPDWIAAEHAAALDRMVSYGELEELLP
jgi:hypothetical protein